MTMNIQNVLAIKQIIETLYSIITNRFGIINIFTLNDLETMMSLIMHNTIDHDLALPVNRLLTLSS